MPNISTFRNQAVLNQPTPTQPVPDNEVQAGYARRKERMNEEVIGAKHYLAPFEYGDVGPLSNVVFFALTPCFDIVVPDQDGFCDR